MKREAGIATRTVGLIATAKQAETIVAEGKADMVALARAMLDDPHWGWHAAQALGAEVARPKQYQRRAEGVGGSEPIAIGRRIPRQPLAAREHDHRATTAARRG